MLVKHPDSSTVKPCWLNLVLLKYSRWHLDGSRCCSKTCRYLPELIQPFQMCKLPVLQAPAYRLWTESWQQARSRVPLLFSLEDAAFMILNPLIVDDGIFKVYIEEHYSEVGPKVVDAVFWTSGHLYPWETLRLSGALLTSSRVTDLLPVNPISCLINPISCSFSCFYFSGLLLRSFQLC